jgi:hypothetical protein
MGSCSSRSTGTLHRDLHATSRCPIASTNRSQDSCRCAIGFHADRNRRAAKHASSPAVSVNKPSLGHRSTAGVKRFGCATYDHGKRTATTTRDTYWYSTTDWRFWTTARNSRSTASPARRTFFGVSESPMADDATRAGFLAAAT